MSLIVSAPRGLRIIGIKTLIFTTLAWCLLPALPGGIGWIVMDLGLGGGNAGDRAALQMLFYLMLLSPLVSGPFWIAIGIGTALFCRYGAYGSLTALVWGAIFGAGSVVSTGVPELIVLGAILATFHRFSLAVLRPEAF
ncbi:hypothetical protein [Pseudogemmobacter bohemicus]|uniref:hypothetical protein n=1 Tax=Pseudogemmobacter bohemicus TaxID=2250708 RepID=UPI000DD3245F|nr:hypothetical protein [Pseudogemmobacter bohemicus]